MMPELISRLFIHTPSSPDLTADSWRAKASAAGDINKPQPSTPVFITPESLTSFPIASVAVGLLAQVVIYFWPTCSQGGAVLGSSLLIGLLIFLVNIEKPGTRPKSTVQWIVAIMVALVNTLFLAAAVLGIRDSISTRSD